MFGKRKKKRDEIKKNLREKLDYKMKRECCYPRDPHKGF